MKSRAIPKTSEAGPQTVARASCPSPHGQDARATNSSRGAGFTLAEVLAALLLMAIVIPVATEGMRIASLAGSVAARKGEAARVAQRVLNDNLVTTNWMQSFQSGSAQEGQRQFRWTLRGENWTEDPNQSAMQLLSIEVFFTAQNREFSVRMSTLVDTTTLLGTNQ